MARVKMVSVGMGLTLQPAAYESIRADVRIDVELTAKDDYEKELDLLRASVRNQLQETVVISNEAYEKATGRCEEETTEDTDDDWV